MIIIILKCCVSALGTSWTNYECQLLKLKFTMNGGNLTLTHSHLYHYWHIPTMAGFCHVGNMPASHDDDDDGDDGDDTSLAQCSVSGINPTTINLCSGSKCVGAFYSWNWFKRLGDLQREARVKKGINWHSNAGRFSIINLKAVKLSSKSFFPYEIQLLSVRLYFVAKLNFDAKDIIEWRH